jgi:serine/threonine protein kinase/tetratricopeptide (TPR) repeat protein
MQPRVDLLESILAAAVEMTSEAERRQFVDQACAGDGELKRRVEELIDNHFQAGSFLEAPAPNLSATRDEPVGERPGTVIGPYKLMEQIGEGGMGLVFVAEQLQPVRRKVALKVIKPGMDTRHVVARFEAERQALALMDHPNIAQVHDGGTTANGRPYFVMELVKGVPITDYCDQNQVPIRQRLELFLSICQAVQHAHQKGIIHRDIKPSNVLVMSQDGTPLVKVIDFGIAKAIGQQLTDKTIYTQFTQLVGTPLYMSPEQAGQSSVDVDTRSDIYSLGVLLYELLTGTTPFDPKRLKEAGFDEMRRIIREEEPPRPSTRISTMGQAASTVSSQRKSDPRRLSQLFRGELDWIVMKALEKDRNRRYESANGFAQDVQRYLADEPVLACPPSGWYRLRKYARRNRGWLAAAGVLGLALLVAAGGIGWGVRDQAARQARAANDLEQALDRAELFQGEGKQAEALAALGRAELLAGQAPADPARDERLAALRRDQEFLARFEEIRLDVQSRVNVNRSSFSYEAAFPEVRAALNKYGIAISSMAPAEAAACVQGRPEHVRRQLVAALQLCLHLAPKGDTPTRQWLLAALEADDNNAWQARVRRAVAGRDWKVLKELAGEADEAKQPPSFLLFLAESLPAQMRSTRLELLQRTQRAYPADLWTNLCLANRLMETGQPGQAVRYWTAALALRPDNPGIHVNRGMALLAAGEVSAATADFRRAVALAPQYAAARSNLGLALSSSKGGLDEAIAEHHEAIRLNKDCPEFHNNLGVALKDKGRLDEAIASYREALRLRRDFPDARCNLGAALKAKGLVDDAIAEYREVLRLEPDHGRTHNNLGTALKAKGQLDEAIAEYREAIRLDKDHLEAHINLGNALAVKGRLDEAIAEYRVAIRIKNDDPLPRNNLGAALVDKGLLDEAIAEYREAIRLKEDYDEAHINLGIALANKGRLDEAIAEYREAIRLEKDLVAEARFHLGRALVVKGLVNDAIAEYRKAIALEPNYAEAHCNLGHALRQQGEFRDALTEMRRGHELGSRAPGWRYPSAQWVRQCERLVDLDEKLPGFRSGKSTPASTAERIELAGLCILKHLNRAAARFYDEAFAAEPTVVAPNRYNAACVAALAGCGQGKDADKLEEKERYHLRCQALDWLRAELEANRLLLEKDANKAGPTLPGQMRHWLRDPDFGGVRGPEALAKLPEAERQPWQKLWQDVDDLLKRAQGTAAPQKK